jgi:hypothetical protein
MPGRCIAHLDMESASRGRVRSTGLLQIQHVSPDGAAAFILGVLALVGFVAVVLLILGLLNVHGVTEHFSIH